MIILEHSTYDGNTISKNFGGAEYSYWFVRKAFRPLLERFGVVVPVANPAKEVDPIHRSATQHGIPSLFLSFNPPHCTPLGLDCPTVPVFAWEYDTIPTEIWHDDPLNDWAGVLRSVPAAVTHSRYSADAIRRSLGPDYPVRVIPAPVYAAKAGHAGSARGWHEAFEFDVGTGLVIDSRAIDLSLFAFGRAETVGAHALGLLEQAAAVRGRPVQRLTLTGVVYSSVFNTVDGRKNWNDMVAGFVWAFRHEPHATLVLKVAHRSMQEGVLPILAELGKLGPFACRVVVVHGLLSDEEYARLVEVSAYTVNTSHGEGQCLPLMEFMAAGRPAITVRHSAMLDYVSTENAFVVASDARPGFWPHDMRQATRCIRYQTNFTELVRCYQESFRVARDEPERYARLSAAANAALAAFCSDAVVSESLGSLFRTLALGRTAQKEPA